MSAKVVVITGASGGIGAAVAKRLAGHGMSVVLTARRKKELDAVAAECGALALPVVADMTRREDVRRVVAEALQRFGHVDVWINNAGQGITRPPTQLTDDDVDAMVRINIKSVLYGTQEILPHFKERGTGQIINISSMLGRIPFAVFRSAYSGAKHFVNALTALMRVEVQETHPGIQFTLVSPGVVRTDFGLNALHGGPDSRALPGAQGVEEVAEVIAGAIESRAPDIYTGKGSSGRVAGYYATVGADPS